MSIEFSHSSKFDIGEFRKRNWRFNRYMKAEPFVLIHQGTYLEFEMLLFLSGIRTKSGTITQGVFVALRSLNEEGRKLCVNFKVSIFLSNGSSHLVEDWREWREWENIRICPKPVAGNLAMLKTKSLLVDNETHLCLGMELKISQSNFDMEEVVQSNISLLDCRNIGFCSELYAERDGPGDTSNFEIVCRGTEQKFRIHMLVAQKRSPYFKNIFTSHPNFDQEKTHEVGWSPQLTEEIIHFIYFDHMAEDSIPSLGLLDLANMLELKKLVAICEMSFLDRIITEENAWYYLGIADLYGMKFLKKKALCIVTEDPDLMDKLVDEESGVRKELRKEVGEFLMKRARAHQHV